ncbi:MAG: hypothetical protein K0R14_208 [Burkholderiales bacterium]|jgi:hypothetical protein|nr:hypothetical protein [Burkholderiales bacterium]
MKLLFILFFSIFLIVSCGDGSSSSSNTNYYSASSNLYYEINTSNESGVESLALSVVATTGNLLNNVPLTLSGNNSYTFNGGNTGSNISGSLVLKNNQMGISINGTSTTSFADFAVESEVTNNNSIPNGTYTTVCDQNNISACSIVINNNQISITEFSVSGQSTTLCQGQAITTAPNAQNPFLSSFSCGVQGGTHTGTWYIMPIVVNNTTGIMINEYNASVASGPSFTNEIAFPQATFTPNGTYNYVYNGVSSNSGIATATFSSAGLVNSIIGTCSGAVCALVQGQYAGSVGASGNTMVGFDYYSVGGTVNYNLVGSTSMNIFMDSYSGIYF